MNKIFFNDFSIWLSSDTFVKEITIFTIGTPGILMCGIVLNTEICPDVSSLLVEWYHNNSISSSTLGYTVSSLAKGFAKEFNSTLKISQVESSQSGSYTCVARIGEKIKRSHQKIYVLIVCNIKCICLSIILFLQV